MISSILSYTSDNLKMWFKYLEHVCHFNAFMLFKIHKEE